MSFELPTRQGRSKRPVPAISIGARRRGKAGKLTPYVLFTAEAAEMLFGVDCQAVQLSVGAGEDEGWIQIVGAEKGNVRLRRQPNITTDLLAETVLIPYKGDSPLRRSEAEVRLTESKELQIKLPWGREGSIRSKAASLDKPKRGSKKSL